MKKNTLRYSLLLLLTAAIWGFAFVAQSVGMDYVQPFTFTAARSLIGGIVLLPFIFIRAQKTGRTFCGKIRFLETGTARRHHLRCSAVYRIESAADRHTIYDRWKKRFYHSNVHRACSGTRYTFSQENRYPRVDLCGTCCMRTVSFMYDRRFLSSAARRICIHSAVRSYFPCRFLPWITMHRSRIIPYWHASNFSPVASVP